VKFDVLAIETEEGNRPPGFALKVINYLSERGYKNVTAQQGRNTCEYYIYVETKAFKAFESRTSYSLMTNC
jgi:hypothetical protein